MLIFLWKKAYKHLDKSGFNDEVLFLFFLKSNKKIEVFPMRIKNEGKIIQMIFKYLQYLYLKN